MRSVYHRACSYAFKCSPQLSKDLVHEAWLRHYRKEGTDLFDRDIFIVLRWVKNVWFNELRSRMYMKDGEYRNRQFFTPSEEWSDDASNIILRSSYALPDSEIITREFYEDLFKRVDGPQETIGTHNNGYVKKLDPSVVKKLLELLDVGYKSAEICEEMNISPQSLYYYKKKLQKIIETRALNPEEFIKLTEAILNYLTNKTKNNGRQQ